MNLGQKHLPPFQLLNSLYQLKLETLFINGCIDWDISVFYQVPLLKSKKDHLVCSLE